MFLVSHARQGGVCHRVYHDMVDSQGRAPSLFVCATTGLTIHISKGYF